MPNITLAVPDDLHRRMKRHPEVRWSEIVRRILADRVRTLEAMDRIASRSVLTIDWRRRRSRWDYESNCRAIRATPIETRARLGGPAA